MFVDGILFGVMIGLGFLTAWRLSGGVAVQARTAAFVIALLSPQVYAFVLRDGSLWRKLTAPNFLLKLFLLLNLAVTWALVYIPALNVVFGTAPLENYYVLWAVFWFALFTPLFRLVADSRKPQRTPKNLL